MRHLPLTILRHKTFADLLLLTGMMALLGTLPVIAASPEAESVLHNYPQASNMAGYVLNSELNMDNTYSRKLDQNLLPSSKQWDQSPVIILEPSEVQELQQPRFLMNMPPHWSSSPKK